ncbi:ECF transporter S component [Metabacillus fastidiosus]|uniref:ECF transporter S component n=1 Tax=Metabacillus fastidiosus TaxID=1458 RepID=UPI002E21FA35|nr:ECF transporter S component [Metabacillus fastidiosus]
MNNSKSLNLREIVVISSISVVFGILYLIFIFFSQFIKGIFGPVGSGFMAGSWIMASVVCAYIVRKPGVALIAEMIAAGTEILIGSVSAGTVLILGFTQGIGSELAFALFLYRSYRLPTLMLSGAFGVIANFITIYFLFGYSQYSVIITAFMFGAMLISGILWGGWASKATADSLCRTGVLDNFALGKIYRQKRMKNDELSQHS